jgi:hypothetical protein
MQRFFFDVAEHTHVQYDFRGRMFTTEEQAREMAALIALDLGCTKEPGPGAEVQVRNVSGFLLFSVPANDPDTVAA